MVLWKKQQKPTHLIPPYFMLVVYIFLIGVFASIICFRLKSTLKKKTKKKRTTWASSSSLSPTQVFSWLNGPHGPAYTRFAPSCPSQSSLARFTIGKNTQESPSFALACTAPTNSKGKRYTTATTYRVSFNHLRTQDGRSSWSKITFEEGLQFKSTKKKKKKRCGPNHCFSFFRPF